MGKYALPLGFRFHPTDVELVKYYLKKKLLGKKFPFEAIAEVDIYKYAPWDLPDLSCLKTGDLKWFFFCPIEKKYARGCRMNRATVYGFWKTTGKDRAVKYNDEIVGMIKTLVFHQGKAPCGSRTDWVMHEYRIEEKELADRGVLQDSYVLCVVFKKDGMGPKNGAQYGAPFKEEDWSDSEDTNLVETGFLSGISALGSGGASTYVPESVCAEPSFDSGGLHTSVPQMTVNSTVSVTSDIDSNALPLVFMTDANGALTSLDVPDHPLAVLDSNADPVVMDTPQLVQAQESSDNILSLLDIFTEEDINGGGQMTGNSNYSFLQSSQVSDEDDISAMLASFTEEDNLNNASYPFE